MIELPEGIVLAKQIASALTGKHIKSVVANSSPHKFAWYQGNPADYSKLFADKEIEQAYSYGGKLHIKLNQDCGFMFCEGISVRYCTHINELPKKHQLLIEFDDATYFICTVRMYGGIYGYTGLLDNEYDHIARTKPSVLSEDFNLKYFMELLTASQKPKLSAKAFLATEQRIPGLGNGVVQDVLFNAGIHPKRDMATLGPSEVEQLFHSVKETIAEMTEHGGRDVETDLYGNPGGYKTIMSKNTYTQPCPKCGGPIRKEAYLGGSVYYCNECQK